MNIKYNKVIKSISYLGFIITLILMEATYLGQEGLKIYASDFQIFDMKFSYSSECVYSSLKLLSIEGIHHYMRLILIDFVFIICFLGVQYDLTNKIISKFKELRKYKLAFLFVFLRAVFDIVENLSILSILINYPSKLNVLVTISSFSTSLKFICIIGWVICLILMLIQSKILKR